MKANKALSIKQPWASLIAHGIKDIENRTWKTNFRGRIYIHTSGKWTAESAEISINNPNVKQALESVGMIHKYDVESIGHKGYSFSGLIHGAIIGEVDIVDCVIDHPSIWAEKISESNYQIAAILNVNPKPIYNWVLANAVLYEKPILHVKGKLSFWEPDIDISECIGCSGKFDYETMQQDDGGEDYCPVCASEMFPVMKAEYDEMVRNGEIEE